MNEQDKSRLAELLDGASEYYQRDDLSAMSINMYFEALLEFTIEQIESAFFAHVRSGTGQYFPKAADFIRHIKGGEFSPEQIVAAARSPQTPLGVLARIKISSWDLDNMNQFYLNDRAQEFLQSIEQIKERALKGRYTNHELKCMMKFKVDPRSSFDGKSIQPSTEVKREITERLPQIRKQLALENGSTNVIAISDSARAKNKEMIAKTIKNLISNLEPPKEAEDDD